MARDVGHGSLKKGERVLDLFVKKVARRGTAPSEAVAAAHAMPIGSDKTQNGPVVRVDDRCGVAGISAPMASAAPTTMTVTTHRVTGDHTAAQCRVMAGASIPFCSAFGACWLACN